MPGTFVKDPSERLDYQEDWSDWLDSDTISSSIWSVPTGLTQYGSATSTTTVATIWLSGGTHGQEYLVTNTVTTAGGRIGERSIKILVREQ